VAAYDSVDVRLPIDPLPNEQRVHFFEHLRDPESGEMRLPAHPASCSLARELTLELLQSWGLAALGEAAAQLVAELAANSIIHSGGSTLRLRVVRRGGSVRIEVRDPSQQLPLLIIGGDVEDDHGRGMHVVDALADHWGADLLPYGKGVWCDLHIPRG